VKFTKGSLTGSDMIGVIAMRIAELACLNESRIGRADLLNR
jgi:hypothetical protein